MGEKRAWVNMLMAQKKHRALTEPSARSIAQKARRARELKAISDIADANLADTEHWRVLLPEHLAAIKFRVLGGETLGNICRDLGITRAVVCNYIFENPAYAKDFLAFKAFGGHMLYENLIDMIEDKTMSKDDKMFAYKVINSYVPKINREVYGDTPGSAVTVTVKAAVIPDYLLGDVQQGQLVDDQDPTV